MSLKLTQSECNRQLAHLHRLNGRWKEAIEAAWQAALQAPDNLEAFNLLGALLLENGDYDRAIDVARQWLDQNARSICALELLAHAHWHKADFASATRVYNKLLSYMPHETNYRYCRGKLYQRLDAWRPAMEDFKQLARMSSEESMRAKAQQAIEQLDQAQLHKIMQMLFDCPLFRVDFNRNREEAVALRGFSLSDNGWQTLRWLQSDWSEVAFIADQANVPFD